VKSDLDLKKISLFVEQKNTQKLLLEKTLSAACCMPPDPSLVKGFPQSPPQPLDLSAIQLVDKAYFILDAVYRVGQKVRCCTVIGISKARQ